MNRFWPFVLGLLAQFVSCADRHLELWQLQFEPVAVARLDEVRHAGMVGENQFILVTGEPDSVQPRTLVRIDADANEQSLILPTKDTRCRGEALIVHGSRWWYSRCTGNGVQFVTSDAPASPSFAGNDDSALDPREWLPFGQGDPSGVLLSIEKDQRTMIARKVTPSGIGETLGRFDRESILWGAERGEAVRLGSDRVALITIENTSSGPPHSSIVLRIIHNSEIATSRVAFDESGWRSLAAATDPAGNLAIVAAPYNGSGVVAVMVDPAQPDRITTRHLTHAAATGLRLIASGDRFIASWVRLRDLEIQIAEFDGRVVLPAVTVANPVAGFLPAISLGHAPGEDSSDITVFWTEDGDKVMLRRLPEPPTGSLIASDLLRAVSDWARGRRR